MPFIMYVLAFWPYALLFVVGLLMLPLQAYGVIPVG